MMNLSRAGVAFASLLFLAACDSDSDSDSDPASADDSGAPEQDSTTDAEPAGDAAPESDASTGEDAPVSRCSYPSPVGGEYEVAYLRTMPDLYWEPAYLADGTSFRFDLYDFYCNEEYDAYDTLIVVLSAGWCPQCPRLIDWVDRLGPRLEEEGALVLFVEGENNNRAQAFSDDARTHFARHTATNGTGIRVGDGSGSPANSIVSSSLVRGFPSSFVVRRRDMAMIVESNLSDFILPYVEIAMDPERDWSSPPSPEIVPTYPANCGEEDEESFEPNNFPEDAGLLSPGDTVDGGICDQEPDFYRVEHEGRWSFRMEFDANEADLDVYVWDAERDRPVADADGRPIGSFTYEPVEQFEHEGPALLYVHGYQGETTTYTITFDAL